MSFALDVNILLFASDAASPAHRRASAFLESCASGDEAFYVAWSTLMAYLRIATHARVFSAPMTSQQAEENVDRLLALPHFRVLAELDGFWEVYRSVVGDVPARGNLVPDAHLAALLKQHGIRTLYTNDRDFRRYRFLDVRDPLASAS